MELCNQEESSYYQIMPRGTINEFIRSSSHIQAGAAIMPAWNGESYFTYVQNGEKVGLLRNLFQVDPALISDVICFEMVAGNADCLTDPDQILIPESIADQFSGNDPIGQTLTCNDNIWANFQGPKDLIIGGVYKDFPDNSLMENGIYISIKPGFQVNNFNSANFECFIKLDDPAYVQEVCDAFIKNFKEESWQKPTSASLTLLSDLYLQNPQTKNRVRLFICIALLIIVIAAINFTNFATALAPVRMKSINTMKVMGASTQSLRTSLLFEGICTALLSFGIGLLVVRTAEKTHLLSFLANNIHLSYNLWPLLLTATVAIIIGFIAGIWPSVYLTSFSPALVLKGSYGLSPKGRRFRTVLISIQFIVSFGLIIASFGMDRQNRFLLNQNLGFNSQDVAVVQLSNAHLQRKEFYINNLKSHSQVRDVAFASIKMGTGEMVTSENFKYNGVSSEFTRIVQISHNLLSLLEVPLLDGRWATQGEEDNRSGVVLVNRYCQKAMNIIPETPVDYYRGKLVAGIVGDVNITSLRYPMSNTLYLVTDNQPVSYIKFEPGTTHKEASKIIESTLGEIDPVYPISIDFYDNMLADLYREESDFGMVIRLFSLLAIVISIMGVFGMVVFETQYRKKEIGVRKIMGSTIKEILFMFNKKYIVLSVVCCLIASPIAYLLINRWLNGFAYHTTLQWWTFLVAFVLVTLVTLVTVTWQSWRSATVNPVESLKNE